MRTFAPSLVAGAGRSADAGRGSCADANLRERLGRDPERARRTCCALALGVTGDADMRVPGRCAGSICCARSAPRRSRRVFKTTVIGFAALDAAAGAGRRGRAALPAGAARAASAPRRRSPPSCSSGCSTWSTVLVLFAVYLVFSPTRRIAVEHSATFVAAQVGRHRRPRSPRSSASAFMMLAAGHPETLGAWAWRGRSGVLPGEDRERGGAAGAHVSSKGCAVVRQPRRLAVAWLLSLPLWLSIALGIWLASQAFHIEMPLRRARS
ncbi:MAG: hypothetical protein MZW92_53825 [Comamonadaceae bacterium]|nr:hypothetical protein [Comamonadaceae bacterium]